MENIALAVGAGRAGPEGLPWLPGAQGAWAGSSAASLVTYSALQSRCRPELSQSPPARPVRPWVRALAVRLVTWSPGSSPRKPWDGPGCPQDGNLQTQALVNITISDLLLASYVATPGISPSMEEETGAERGAVPLLGSQSWEVEALAFDPRRLTTTVDPRNVLGCSHLAGGESAGWGVWPAQGCRAVRHGAGPGVGFGPWPCVWRSPAGRPREGGGLTVPAERPCRLAPGVFITPGVSSLPGLHSVLKCSDVQRAFFIRAMKLFSACCQAVVKRRSK